MKFLRRTWSRYSKLGKGRKKKQKWRRPTGRDNKMRENKKGHPKVVSVGFRKSNKLKEENKLITVKNLGELEKVKKGSKIILGHVGKKKKTELMKKAKEMNISIKNIGKKK